MKSNFLIVFNFVIQFSFCTELPSTCESDELDIAKVLSNDLPNLPSSNNVNEVFAHFKQYLEFRLASNLIQLERKVVLSTLWNQLQTATEATTLSSSKLVALLNFQLEVILFYEIEKNRMMQTPVAQEIINLGYIDRSEFSAYFETLRLHFQFNDLMILDAFRNMTDLRDIYNAITFTKLRFGIQDFNFIHQKDLEQRRIPLSPQVLRIKLDLILQNHGRLFSDSVIEIETHNQKISGLFMSIQHGTISYVQQSAQMIVDHYVSNLRNFKFDEETNQKLNFHIERTRKLKHAFSAWFSMSMICSEFSIMGMNLMIRMLRSSIMYLFELKIFQMFKRQEITLQKALDTILEMDPLLDGKSNSTNYSEIAKRAQMKEIFHRLGK